MTRREHSSISSPSDVATAFFAALHEARWDDAVGVVDEEMLAKFHASEVASLLAQAQLRAEFRTMREGGGGVGYSPDPATNAMLLVEFGEMPILGIEGVGTIASYAKLTPAELLARHLEARNGPTYRFAPSTLARIKKHFETQPENQHHNSLPRRDRARRGRVIGEVVETIGPERIAHVVYRDDRSEAEMVEGSDTRAPFGVEILHLRNRSGWRVALGPHDHVLSGLPWFELDFDWEPGDASSHAHKDQSE